jgi:hypothetical protein
VYRFINNVNKTIDENNISNNREFSDHDGTYVTIGCGFSNNKNYKRKIWDHKRADYLVMKQCVGLLIMLTKPLMKIISLIFVGILAIQFMFKSPKL